MRRSILLKTKLKNENIGYALYPIKEVQNLYSCKLRYESLLKELEQLQKENWHLKQLLLRTSK